ncbi:MAG: ARMT1-like domain-containing protein [Desulforhopalus sp.]|nr:ARMT1-like domain-containing protein [Desulforhopalus sp.]
MKTDAECLPCFIRQALQVAKVAGCSPAVQMEVVKKVAEIVAGLDSELDPPANAEYVYRAIAAVTGNDDPYRQLKIASNEQALKIIPAISHEIEGGGGKLAAIVRFAIAGNCIDYGAFASVDILGALDACRNNPLAVDHIAHLQERIESLAKGAEVLYLADNSGEIVYDRLLIKYLFERGLKITLAVKDGPIINDALLEDARAAGLDSFARIISNGSRCPGTVLPRCSEEFRRLFAAADLVISKGQGNFESLSEESREIFFLLMIKCGVAAKHIAELSGINGEHLPGRGEMALYSSALRQQHPKTHKG